MKAWRRTDGKQLPEPGDDPMSQWLAHKYVARPQWVNDNVCIDMAMGLAPNMRQASVDISVPKWHMELSTTAPCYSGKSIILTTGAHDRCSWNKHEIRVPFENHTLRRPTIIVPWNGSSWNIKCLIKSCISINVFQSVETDWARNTKHELITW